jgi:hypothetical protein
MTSHEDYESARALGQWAVNLDPHNATALAREHDVHGVQCNILRLHNESGYNKADAWLAR